MIKRGKLSLKLIRAIVEDERAYKIIAYEYGVSESSVGHYKRNAGNTKYCMKHNGLPAEAGKPLCHN